MNNELSFHKINSEGTIFEILANILKLKEVRPGVFVDTNGKEFWLTKYGFEPLAEHRDKQIANLNRQIQDLSKLFDESKQEIENLKKTNKTLRAGLVDEVMLANDTLGRKSKKMVKSILNSSLSDEEKVKEIGLYLNQKTYKL